jgi:hypothetical protein
MLEIGRMREMFSYDPVTGIVRWRINRASNARAGQAVGTLKKGANNAGGGYLVVSLKMPGTRKNKTIRVHRLAWALHYGEWPPPDMDVDHKNLVRHENWIDNLRLATRSQNNGNLPCRKDNRLGIKGVRYLADRCEYSAEIRKEGKRRHLGYYPTAEMAQAAYQAAAEVIHGSFARVA